MDYRPVGGSHQICIRKYNYSYYMLIDAEEDPPILSYPYCPDYPPLLSSTLHEDLHIQPQLSSTLLSDRPDCRVYDQIDPHCSVVYSEKCWYYGRYATSRPVYPGRSSNRAVRFDDRKLVVN